MLLYWYVSEFGEDTPWPDGPTYYSTPEARRAAALKNYDPALPVKEVEGGVEATYLYTDDGHDDLFEDHIEFLEADHTTLGTIFQVEPGVFIPATADNEYFMRMSGRMT